MSTDTTSNQPSPTLTKMTYSFDTTSNDKDWNTTVGAEVIINGHDVAQQFGLDKDKHVDHWNDGSSHGPWVLPIAENPTKEQLDRGIYRVSITAHNDDRWDYQAHLHAEFSDGTQRNWTFLNGTLNSINVQTVSQDFPLSDHHD